MSLESQPGSSQTAAMTTAGRPGVLRRLLANSGMLLGGRAANAVMNLAATALAIRALGLEAFGVLTLIHTYALVVGNIFSFKLGQTVLTYGAPRLERGDAVGFRRLIAFLVRLEAVATLAAVAAGALAVAWIGPAMGWPSASLGTASAYMAVIAFQTNRRVAAGVLQLFNRFDRIAIGSSLQPMLRLVGTAVLFLLGTGELGLFLLIWFSALMIQGIAFTAGACRELWRRSLLPHSLRGTNAQALRDDGIWRFVWLTNLNATLGLTLSQLGTLLVGGLFGPAQAGLFHVADKLARAAAKPVESLRPAIGPELARLVAKDAYRRLRRLILRSILIGASVALIVLGVLALFGDHLLELLGGTEARGAYRLLLLLATAALLRLIAFPFAPLLQTVRRPGRLLASQIVATLSYVAGVIGFVPILGVEGVGVAAIMAAATKVTIEIATGLPRLKAG